MNKVFITNKFFKYRLMRLKVSIVYINNCSIKCLIVSTIDIDSTTKSMIRVRYTANSLIEARTTITGRNKNWHVNTFANGNKNVFKNINKIINNLHIIWEINNSKFICSFRFKKLRR